MVCLPVRISGIKQSHVESDTWAEDSGYAAKQIHGCKLHTQTQSGTTTPWDQIFVESFALLGGFPPTRKEIERTLKDGRIKVHILACC